MSSNDANDRKRKSTKIQDTVPGNDGRNSNEESNKARRVSTSSSASNAASPQVDTPVKTETTANTVSTATKNEESIQISLGKMVRDLFCSDNAKVNSALVALHLNLDEDKKKCESFVTAGGCLALVQLLEQCLDKAVGRILASGVMCDQVTELNELVLLTTLRRTLSVVIRLTFQHDASNVGIAAIGGAEAVVQIMKTFPKCQTLQKGACTSLLNLTLCSIGKKKAIESGGIEVLIAAINNHFLGSAILCHHACWALECIASVSKENTRLLISLGGGAAVAKVRTKWPDNNDVQTKVRRLASFFVAEWKVYADEE
jgi:hypothetical protein